MLLETGLFAATAVAAVQGASAVAVRPGETHFDALTSESAHTLRIPLRGGDGEALTIELRSFDFDAVLRVEDERGQRVAEDDDGGIETNARVVLRADHAAGCVVVVTSKPAGRAGEFSLAVERGDVPVLAESAAQDAAIVFRGVAAERALDRGDRAAAAEHRLREGDWRYARSDFVQAERAFRGARDLATEVENGWIEAQAHSGLGRCAFARGAHTDAIASYEAALMLYRDLRARLDEGRTLLNLGIVHEIRLDYAVASSCYEDALRLAELARDEFGRARSLTKLGNLERLRGHRQAAREHLGAGLELARRLNDRPGECGALEGLGHWWVSGGKQQEALLLFQRWLAIAREDRDRAAEAAALNSVAVVHAELGDHPRAIECLEHALSIAREVGDRLGEATSLGNLGVSHQSLQDWARAIEFHERHLALTLEIGDRQGEERARSCIAQCLKELGDSGTHQQRALERYAKAIATGGLNGDWDLLAQVAVIRRFQKRFDEARALLDEAFAVRRELGLDEDPPWLLWEYAFTYEDEGSLEQAIVYCERSLQAAIARGADDQAMIWSSLELGRILSYTDDPSRALEHLQRAADMARRFGQRQASVNALRLVGRVQSALGLYEAAQGCSEQALAMARERKLEWLEADTLADLAEVAFFREGISACVRLFDEARAVRPKDRFPWAWARLTLNQGWLLFLAGRLDEAQDATEQALEVYGDDGDDENRRVARSNLACILFESSRVDDAEQIALEVVADCRTKGETRLIQLGDSLWTLARIAMVRGDLARAAGHVDELGSLVQRALHHGYRRGVGLGASNYLLVGWERLRQDLVAARVHASTGADREALLSAGFAEAARSKDRDLLGGIVEHRRGGRSRQAIELRQRREERIAQRESVLNRLSRAVPDGLSVGESDVLRAQASNLEREIGELERTLREISPRDARLDPSEGTTPQTLRAAALGPGDALIEFAEGERRLYAYMLTRDRLELVDLGDRLAIEAAVAEVLGLIGTPATLGSEADVLAASRRAGGLLLAPVVVRAGPDLRRLILVPTGALSGLPFEALIVGEAPRGAPERLETAPFAIDRWEIVYAPSAPVLVELGSLGPRRRGGKVLVLADPAYASDADVPEPKPGSEDPALLGGSVRAQPDARDFQRLAKTRDEALALADLLVKPDETEAFASVARLRGARSGSASARLLDVHLGREAHAKRLRADLKPYSVLHLAAHGFVDRKQSDHSGIALAWDEQDEQHGYFTVADALDLDLDANLVVLSACDTAGGRRRPGEGVESLARAFMFAGARGVVASLWQVSDWAAAETMVAFYRGALERGLHPSHALREAKLALRRSTAIRGVAVEGGASSPAPAAHPYFWAPFVYVGRPE